MPSSRVCTSFCMTGPWRQAQARGNKDLGQTQSMKTQGWKWLERSSESRAIKSWQMTDAKDEERDKIIGIFHQVSYWKVWRQRWEPRALFREGTDPSMRNLQQNNQPELTADSDCLPLEHLRPSQILESCQHKLTPPPIPKDEDLAGPPIRKVLYGNYFALTWWNETQGVLPF